MSQLKVLSVVLALLFFLSLGALHISPVAGWGLAVAGVFAPFLWGLNLVLMGYWLCKRSWWAAFTALPLFLGVGIVEDTLAFTPETAAAGGSCFRVLSYNVSHFNKPREYNFSRDSVLLQEKEQLTSFIDWVVAQPAPVKAFQEFFTYANDPYFNVAERLHEQGWRYSFISADTLQVNKSRFGVAIFSKYPMVARGVIFVGPYRFNRGIWADIALEGDTLRVVNVHLQSAQLQRMKNTNSRFGEAARKMFWMYRSSLRERNYQLRQVMETIKQSPYPVVLTGDFNSTPYSYLYQVLDKHLQNAFEEKGNGFGFTFNHPKLFFLRIDHQFVSNNLAVCSFYTGEEVPYSAHFPIEGMYYFLPEHAVH